MTLLPRLAKGIPTHRPWFGFALGLLGVAVINIGFALFDDHAPRAIPLLLLIAPVSTASVIGGWKASIPLAILTGLAYSYQYVAPIGSVRIGLTEDSASLITYTLVALFISENGRRRETRRRDREHQRALLLSSVSHDLRNPLGAIRAAADELRGEAATDPVYRGRVLDLVTYESERLDRIIRNLLSVGRIEAGALDPDISPESLAEIVRASVARLGRSPRSDLTVLVELPDDLPDVLADRVQLDQVLTNLIENSQRHASGADLLTIRAVPMGDMVEVTLSDNGVGFDPSAVNQVFDLYKTFAATAGEGVGLAVCKAIVEAHGGTIRVDESETGGAQVSFSVPAAR